MIIIRQLRLVCPHLVHNRLKARKHGIDRFSIQLKEVLILSLVRLKEFGFDLCDSLMIALKPHLDVSSSSTIRDSQTQKVKDLKIEHYEPCYLRCVGRSAPDRYEQQAPHSWDPHKSPKLTNQFPEDA